MKQPIRKRALLLRNPKARRGAEPIEPLLQRLEAGGLDVTIETFEALPEIARDIVRLRDRADLVIVCGGDGSVSIGCARGDGERPADGHHPDGHGQRSRADARHPVPTSSGLPSDCTWRDAGGRCRQPSTATPSSTSPASG
jgi:hypothetical protein